jgi:hypothetical protein
MQDVEVPVNGTVVVEDGDVHEIESANTNFVHCWCSDGKHGKYQRTHRLHEDAPHTVGVTTYVVVWEPPQA